jgi:hypothetical protein
MRSSRLGVVGRVMLALLAAFAFSAIVTSAAQAVEEGPYWEVNSKRLLANETREITIKAEGSISLESELKGVQALVTCARAFAEPGSFLAGSSGSSPGTSREVVGFEKCSVKNNGISPCAVEEPIRTEPVFNELVLNDEEPEVGRHAPGRLVLVEFDPLAGTTANFVTLHFKGAGCAVKEANVGEGLVLGQLYTDPEASSGNTLEEIKLETTGRAALTSYLTRFPDEPTSIYLFKTSKFELFEPKQFIAFEKHKAKLTGNILVALRNGQTYNVNGSRK